MVNRELDIVIFALLLLFRTTDHAKGQAMRLYVMLYSAVRFGLEMLRGDYSLGGEQSGHVINREFATTGDGTLTALTLCNEVVQSGKSLKELAADFPQLPQTLINVPNVDKLAAKTNAKVQAAVEREEKMLGDTGRVLLRPSGTEPLVRVMAEAETQQQADEVCERLAKVVADELAL